MTRRLLATIDVGTNSVLMQVARAGGRGGVEVLSDRATITRLGRGVDRSGRLEPASIERTLAVLADYARDARAQSASILAVGTSALRDAANATAFLEPAHAILGTPIEVIDGEREAQLTYLGATHGLSLASGVRCVVDIGGGSTEIVRGDESRVLALTSLDVGAVRLHERHGVGTPASAQQLAAVDRDVTAALAASAVAPCTPLIAIAGTATTLTAIAYGVAPYDAKRIHGARLTLAQVEELAARLAGMSLEERTRVPGLDAGRADVIVTGAHVLLGVMRTAQAREITVSNGGVRMGLAVATLVTALSNSD